MLDTDLQEAKVLKSLRIRIIVSRSETPPLWHGNVDKALECLGLLLFDLEAQRRRFPVAAKLDRGVTEFDPSIRNNQKFIPNFGERYRQGDTISTAFVESTINQVVSKRFVKRQQLQWTLKGVHLLLQTRTKVLDGDLESVFRGWYPQFRPLPSSSPTSCRSRSRADWQGPHGGESGIATPARGGAAEQRHCCAASFLAGGGVVRFLRASRSDRLSGGVYS